MTDHFQADGFSACAMKSERRWRNTAHTNRNNDSHTGNLKRKLTATMIAMLITLFATVSATYAWYIYNTGRHTTRVQMAAGTGGNLEISSQYADGYGFSALLQSFNSSVVRMTPVSTDRIQNGFQKVMEFVKGEDGEPELVAGLFGRSEPADYYQTELFLRTNGNPTDVYVSGISGEDSDAENPISTAIRVGLIVHAPGENGGREEEYIFAINDADNPQAQYNTKGHGQDGLVLDSTKSDGSTVERTPLDDNAYCNYDRMTGDVTLKETNGKITSQKLCTISGDGAGHPGQAVRIEMYIWLEGCDKDCTSNLCNEILKNLSISFAGIPQAE